MVLRVELVPGDPHVRLRLRSGGQRHDRPERVTHDRDVGPVGRTPQGAEPLGAEGSESTCGRLDVGDADVAEPVRWGAEGRGPLR